MHHAGGVRIEVGFLLSHGQSPIPGLRSAVQIARMRNPCFTIFLPCKLPLFRFFHQLDFTASLSRDIDFLFRFTVLVGRFCILLSFIRTFTRSSTYY